MKKRIFAMLIMLALLATLLPIWLIAAADENKPVMMLEGNGKSTKKVVLTWDKVEGATKYVVYGNRADIKKLKKLATVKAKTKYTVKSIKARK